MRLFYTPTADGGRSGRVGRIAGRRRVGVALRAGVHAGLAGAPDERAAVDVGPAPRARARGAAGPVGLAPSHLALLPPGPRHVPWRLYRSRSASSEHRRAIRRWPPLKVQPADLG